MGKPVNLNRFKKQKARTEKSARADQNAALHGLPKAVRDLAKAREEQAARKLTQIKRNRDELN